MSQDESLDGLVKSEKFIRNVTPVKAGIQKYRGVKKARDPGCCRGGDFLRERHN
jgi:hypothetical protein